MREVEAWNLNNIAAYTGSAAGVEWRVPFSGYTVNRLIFNPGHTCPPHAHAFDQWVIVNGGQVQMSIGDTTYDLTAGAIMLIPANTPHSAKFPVRCDMLQIGMGVESISEELQITPTFTTRNPSPGCA